MSITPAEAVAQLVEDQDTFHDIIHGPATGDDSVVETDGGDVPTVARAVASIAGTWIAAGGTADAITGAFTPAVAALTDGLLLAIRAASANATTTPTFKADGTVAHTIVKQGGVALVAGDIPGQYAESLIRYNLANTRWELLNPAKPHGAETGTGSVVKSTSAVLTTPNLGTPSAINLSNATSLAAAALPAPTASAKGGVPNLVLSVLNNTNRSNVTGDSTVYQVPFNNVVRDSASAYNNTTGVFTAPVAGNYKINCLLQLSGVASGHTNCNMRLNINGSPIYICGFNAYNLYNGFVTVVEFEYPIISLSANDTVSISIFGSGGSKVIQVDGSNSSWLSIELVP